MRTVFADYMFDDGTAFSDAARNRYINVAMRHIANWADGMDQSLFVATATYTVSSPSDFHSVPLYTTGFSISQTGAFRFRRFVKMQRTNFDTNKTRDLQAVRHEDADKYLQSTATEALPKFFLAGENVVFLRPPDTAVMKLWYVHDLPDMSSDTDTPGQAAGVGTANALPTEYHHLIPLYASVLALLAEASPDADKVAAAYGEQRDQLQATLRARRGNVGQP